MADPNPARFIVDVLRAVKRDQGTKNELGQVKRQPQQFRTFLELHGAGGFTISDRLVAIGNVLDWLSERNKSFPPKKAERYEEAIYAIKARINWELSDLRDSGAEDRLNFDSLITEFEHFALELDDEAKFPTVDEETINQWEQRITELESSIRESGVDKTVRGLLLDVIGALKSAVRDLRQFGSVACAERLKDTLGRLGVAQAMVPKTEENKGFLKKAWDLFASIVPYVETVGKLKGLPELIHALNPPHK